MGSIVTIDSSRVRPFGALININDDPPLRVVIAEFDLQPAADDVTVASPASCLGKALISAWPLTPGDQVVYEAPAGTMTVTILEVDPDPDLAV